ncbi:hypothetical protein [Acidiphilium sp. C61]|uniref:hypothetical protein n=1 Tax=Acidiphilium sp. C61 TaxID=1671485 RepID=UPI00157B1692|nr:hypothetical protein [Acidiphilium sp. C61]
MSWAEFIASIVKSMAWPTVVVVAILLFRNQIKELIASISELKIGKDGVTGKWDRAAAEVWAGLRKAPTEPRLTQTEKLTFILPTLAAEDQSPNAARIVGAWAQLEKALRKKVGETDETHVGKGDAALVQAAVKRGVITDNQAKSLRGLYALRNLAAHGGDSDVSDARVNEYLAMVEAMETLLEITD